MSDSTLRATQVNVSVVDRSNQYKSMGAMILLAVRKSGQIQLIILRQDKKPLIGLPAVPNVNWVIQNDVYVSMVGGNVRFLLQFANTQEAQIFTMFALSGRLAASPDPICIINKGGSPIASEARFTISYESYDLNAAQIKGPAISKKDVQLSPTDQTPFSAISKSGTLNSTFLVKMSQNVISIVHSIGGSSQQPQASASTEGAKNESQNNNSQSKPQSDSDLEKEEQRKKQQQEIAAQITHSKGGSSQTESSTSKEATAEPSASPSQPSSTSKKSSSYFQQHTSKPQPAQPPKPEYEPQFQPIHKELEAKFNDLSQKIASLRRSHSSQGSNVPQSSDVLVSSIQRLLRENQLKDKLIAEKQQLIDALNERHADTRERDDLRVQLADLGSKLSSQRQITRAKTERQEELNRQIEELQERLDKVKKDSEERLNSLQQRLDEEKQKQLDDLDQQRVKAEENAKTAEEEVEKIREQFEKAMAENKVLKAQASRDISGELSKLKEQMPQLVMKTIKQLVQGIFGVVTTIFDEDDDYDGITVSKQIKRVLESQASKLLKQIDPEGENEGEEEEEEAEEGDDAEEDDDDDDE